MIGKKKNHSIFTKYLLSYLILLILPIILITFFVSKTVFQSLSAEVSENNNISNNLITYSLENELNVCSKIATHINASRDIHPFTLESNAIKAMDLIDTLKKYKVTNTFFDQIFVHFFNDSYIYSETGSYTNYTFFKLFNLKMLIITNFIILFFPLKNRLLL